MNPAGLYARPTSADVLQAMTTVAVALPFFPQNDLALALITEAVHEFIGTKEELEWFRRKAIAWLTAYNGVPELRALFCTRYAPFDGLPPIVDCDENALEAEWRRREMDDNERRLEGYRSEKLLAKSEDSEPFLLPELAEVKSLPPAPKLLPFGSPVADADLRQICPWCADGNPRVRSSVGASLVHTRTNVGRVVCKNKRPLPAPVEFMPDEPAQSTGMGERPPARLSDDLPNGPAASAS